MNPLAEYPAVRKVLYVIQWVANGVTGALGVIFAATADEVPKPFVVTCAVLAFVWTYTGLTASANTPAPDRPRDEGGAVDTLTVILCLVVFLILLLAGVVKLG